MRASSPRRMLMVSLLATAQWSCASPAAPPIDRAPPPPVEQQAAAPTREQLAGQREAALRELARLRGEHDELARRDVEAESAERALQLVRPTDTYGALALMYRRKALIDLRRSISFERAENESREEALQQRIGELDELLLDAAPAR